jgi:hypothetical protein
VIGDKRPRVAGQDDECGQSALAEEQCRQEKRGVWGGYTSNVGDWSTVRRVRFFTNPIFCLVQELNSYGQNGKNKIGLSSWEKSHRTVRLNNNVRRTMPFTIPKTRQMVGLFGILGFWLGFILPIGFAERIFYTTKPYAFMDGWFIVALAFLVAASFAMIPFATVIVERSSSSLRYFTTLLTFTSIWLVIAVLTSVAVSIVTATVHHKTLDIPSWLIPAGLLLVAILPGVTVLSLGYLRARRYEPCA